jgi:molecular chaperone GrpE
MMRVNMTTDRPPSNHPVPEPTEDERPEETPSPETALEEARAETARIRDQLLRTAADFDNFRKRSRRDIEEADRHGREITVRELLPVFDNLERAAQHAGQAIDAKAVADGVTMVLKLFLEAIGRLDIHRIETVGTPFDPMRHEAIQQLVTDEYPPGTVVTEVHPGYTIGDKLLRAAMVIVARPPPAEPSDPSES